MKKDKDRPSESVPDGSLARLIDLGSKAELFTSPNGIPHASAMVGGGRETWRIGSRAFRAWLAGVYQEKHGAYPSGRGVVADAADRLADVASYQGRTRDVHVRVAHHGGNIYFDLADAEHQVVEITADGWSIVTDPPVRFWRPGNSRALPVPVRGGTCEGLFRFLNVRDRTDRVLVVAWLLGVFQRHGSFPLLVITGEQGAAKSWAARLLKRLVDPSKVDELRSVPETGKQLWVAAAHSHVLAFDNISSIPTLLSDALCSVSSGGGVSDRRLYTDDEEAVVAAKKPVILTGIAEFVTRSDLLDRAIPIELSPIPADQRRTEEEIAREFEAVHPIVLGAIVDAVSAGLRNLPTVKPRAWPRMADFAKWVSACVTSVGITEEGFAYAYETNREGANSAALDAPVPAAIMRLVESGAFKGNHEELRKTLMDQERVGAGDREWPKSGKGMQALLKRLAPNLRSVGVDVTYPQRTAKSRPVLISRRSDGRGDDGDGSGLEAVTDSGASVCGNDSCDGNDGCADRSACVGGGS